MLDALGVGDAVEQLPSAELRAMLAEIRVYAGSHRRLESGAAPESGWAPAEAALIQDAGDVPAGLPRMIERVIAPSLDELAARLAASGGRFLDIGAGAATLSIAMARTWPQLHVVGVEPWAPALEFARASVHAAGLSGRVELRQQRAEELADRSRYELAWLPTLFIAEPAAVHRGSGTRRAARRRLIAHARAARRPGLARGQRGAAAQRGLGRRSPDAGAGGRAARVRRVRGSAELRERPDQHHGPGRRAQAAGTRLRQGLPHRAQAGCAPSTIGGRSGGGTPGASSLSILGVAPVASVPGSGERVPVPGFPRARGSNGEWDELSHFGRA